MQYKTWISNRAVLGERNPYSLFHLVQRERERKSGYPRTLEKKLRYAIDKRVSPLHKRPWPPPTDAAQTIAAAAVKSLTKPKSDVCVLLPLKASFLVVGCSAQDVTQCLPKGVFINIKILIHCVFTIIPFFNSCALIQKPLIRSHIIHIGKRVVPVHLDQRWFKILKECHNGFRVHDMTCDLISATPLLISAWHDMWSDKGCLSQNKWVNGGYYCKYIINNYLCIY